MITESQFVFSYWIFISWYSLNLEEMNTFNKCSSIHSLHYILPIIFKSSFLWKFFHATIAASVNFDNGFIYIYHMIPRQFHATMGFL